MAVQWPPIICSLLACCLCLLLLFASPLWHANTAVNTQRPLRPPPCCVPVGAGGAEHQKTGGSGQLLGRTHLASPRTQTQHTNLEVLCMSWCADFEFRVTQTHLWDVRSQTRTSSMTRVWRTSTRLPYPTRFSSLPTRYCSLALLPVSALYKLLSSHPSAVRDCRTLPFFARVRGVQKCALKCPTNPLAPVGAMQGVVGATN